jgi:hypothetical protein
LAARPPEKDVPHSLRFGQSGFEKVVVSLSAPDADIRILLTDGGDFLTTHTLSRRWTGAAPKLDWALNHSLLRTWPTAARCGNGFVKCREDPGFANRRREAVSVHVGPQVRTDPCEDYPHILAGQLID